VPYLKVYRVYIKDHEQSIKRLSVCKNNSTELAKFLEDFKTTHGHDAEYFLNEPVKHWFTLVQFLDELLKHTPKTHAEYNNLVHTCEILQKFNQQITLEIENSKAFYRMFEIIELLEDSSSLLLPTRKYLTEGTFLIEPTKNEKTVFLFNDLILIGDKHNNKIRESHRISLSDCQLVDLPNTHSEYSFQIKYHNDSITLIAATEQLKLKFVNGIKDSS